MNKQVETLVKKFIVNQKQTRYLNFFKKDKTRKKFIEELYHFNDFDWKLFREISGEEDERKIITSKIRCNKNISTCYVISVDTAYDGKIIPAGEAIEKVVGIEGTILIFGDAEIVYYEGEAPKHRYISR